MCNDRHRRLKLRSPFHFRTLHTKRILMKYKQNWMTNWIWGEKKIKTVCGKAAKNKKTFEWKEALMGMTKCIHFRWQHRDSDTSSSIDLQSTFLFSPHVSKHLPFNVRYLVVATADSDAHYLICDNQAENDRQSRATHQNQSTNISHERPFIFRYILFCCFRKVLVTNKQTFLAGKDTRQNATIFP